jgi:hypothetical protein
MIYSKPSPQKIGPKKSGGDKLSEPARRRAVKSSYTRPLRIEKA